MGPIASLAEFALVCQQRHPVGIQRNSSHGAEPSVFDQPDPLCRGSGLISLKETTETPASFETNWTCILVSLAHDPCETGRDASRAEVRASLL